MTRTTCEIALAHRAPRRSALGLSSCDGDLAALVREAAAGEERAWQVLVGRFDATIQGVARRHRLSPADRDDVGQRTWMALVVNIARLRDGDALAGWLATTARHECLRVIERSRRELPVDDPIAVDASDGACVEDQITAAERRDALRRALAAAPPHEQRLLRLLLAEPAMSYDEVSAALGIPKGSIGPTRGRCIARLRGDRHLAGLAESA